MKRIAIILVTLCIASGICAQTDTISTFGGDDTAGSSHIEANLVLGISAGATLYNNGNDMSPYYSKYGFTIQLPLLLQWQFHPKWQLSSGLRYDFTWNPLYYNVEVDRSGDDWSNLGLRFRQTPTTMTQKAYSYISHIGIPVELKWSPWPQNRNSLGIAVDLFAGYAVTRHFVVDDINTPGTYDSNSGTDVVHTDVIQPWKLEVGLSLTTSLIGLTHGIRFSANLLPTYIDPATGEKIYTSGISLFL